MPRYLSYFFILTFITTSIAAKVVVITGATSQIKMSESEIFKIYSGIPIFHNKKHITAIHQKDFTIRQAFLEQLYGSNKRSLRATQALRTSYSGRLSHLVLNMKDDRQVIEYVTNQPQYIGYIDEENVDLSKVKVIYRFS